MIFQNKVLYRFFWSQALRVACIYFLMLWGGALVQANQKFFEGELNEREAPPVLIKGDVDGYSSVKEGDRKYDFIIMFPSLTRRQLLSFDHRHLFNAERGVLASLFKQNVFVGKLNLWRKDFYVPNNISVPFQSELYGTMTIEVQKLSYKLHVSHPRHSMGLMAIRGRFPLNKVFKAWAQGESLLRLLNHFKFIRGTSVEFPAQGELSSQDLLGEEWRFNKKLKVSAPNYGSDQLMLNISLEEGAQGELFPMDVKSIGSSRLGVVRLRQSERDQYIFSALMSRSVFREVELKLTSGSLLAQGEEQGLEGGKPLFSQSGVSLNLHPMTMVIQPVRPSESELKPKFLDMIESPQLIGSHQIVCTPPSLPEGLFPLATRLTLYRIESQGGDTPSLLRKVRLWEVFHRSWLSKIDLPQGLLDLKLGQRYILEVIYLGSDREILPSESWSTKDVSRATRAILEI